MELHVAFGQRFPRDDATRMAGHGERGCCLEDCRYFEPMEVMLTSPYDTSTVFTFLNGKQFSLSGTQSTELTVATGLNFGLRRKLEFTSPSENSLDGQSLGLR